MNVTSLHESSQPDPAVDPLRVRPKWAEYPELTGVQRDHIRTLRRRVAWLTQRADNYVGTSASHVHAERAATKWALELIDQHYRAADPETPS